MNRPLVWVAAALIAGIFFASQGWGVLFTVGLGPCLAGLALCLVRRFSYMDRVAVCLAFFTAGALLWEVRHTDLSGDALSRFSLDRPGSAMAIEGVVRETDALLPGQDYTRFLLDVDRVEAGETWRDLRGGVVIRWSSPSQPIFAGERIRATGRLGHELSPVNHGIADVEDYLRARGVHSEMRVAGKQVVRLESPTWSFRYWLSRFRQHEAEALFRAVPADTLPFVLAVWLGERSQLAEQERDSYTLSGTAHILSVSGVHMAIVYMSASFVLGVFMRRTRARTLCGMTLVLLFALLTGARIATVRSAIMILVYLAADLFDREPDAPTALSLSGILLLFSNPDNLYDPGFLLSFMSVGSLLLFSTQIELWLERVPWLIRRPLAPTLGVQLLPFPLAAHFFHVLPLGAPVANILVIPLLTVVLWLCAATTVIGWVLPAFAVVFGHALYPCVELIRWVAHTISGAGWLHGAVTSPTLPAAILFLVAALALLAPSAQRRWIKPAAVALLFASSLACWRPLQLPAGVDFLDVGHADAALVRTPDDTTFLIDGGDRSEYVDMGTRVVLPFLYANHTSRLDYVVMTHPDRDHGGGLYRVIERMPVDTFLLGPDPSGRKLENDLIALCERRGVTVRRLQRGDTISCGDALIETLHPPKGRHVGENLNDNSLVLRFTWPGMSALFSGDVETTGEQMIAGAPCATEILKVAHHASDTSSSALFLKAAAPEHAVISTRETGKLRAASPHVLSRLAQIGAQVWRTDWHGGVRIRQGPEGLIFDGARLSRGYRREMAAPGSLAGL